MRLREERHELFEGRQGNGPAADGAEQFGKGLVLTSYTLIFTMFPCRVKVRVEFREPIRGALRQDRPFPSCIAVNDLEGALTRVVLTEIKVFQPKSGPEVIIQGAGQKYMVFQRCIGVPAGFRIEI